MRGNEVPPERTTNSDQGERRAVRHAGVADFVSGGLEMVEQAEREERKAKLLGEQATLQVALKKADEMIAEIDRKMKEGRGAVKDMDNPGLSRIASSAEMALARERNERMTDKIRLQEGLQAIADELKELEPDHYNI